MTDKELTEYFIEKFKVVPEKSWTVGEYDDKQGRYCVLGLLGYRETDFYLQDINDAQKITDLFHRYLTICPEIVNDGDVRQYKQTTPKRRIMKALKDILEKTQKINHVNPL